MLSKMRKDFKKYSWTLWIVIITFTGGFILTDLFSGKSAGKDEVIVIGKKTIKGEEFQKQLLMMLRRYNQQFNNKLNKSFIQQLNIPGQCLNSLIQTEVIQNEADKYNIRITDKEVATAAKKAFTQEGKFIGKTQYEALIRRNQLTVTEFENNLKKDLRSAKLKELLTSGLTINEKKLYDSFKQEKETIEADYIALGLDFVKDKINVTDQEISEYFNKNKDSYKTEEQRKGDVVLFKSEDFKKEIVTTDREIANYYLKNKDKFREKGKTKVSRIFLEFTEQNREKIGKNIDAIQAELKKMAQNERVAAFAAKAKEVSQDEKGKEGGDHGYTGWQSFSDPEKTTIKKLSVGEISNVVGTDKGFSVFCVTEKIAPKTKPLNDVKKIIEDTISSERISAHVKKKADELYTVIKDNKALKKTAEEMGYKVITIDFVNNREGIKDVDMTGKISTELFGLKKDEISEPLEFYLGAAILQLKEIKAPHPQELSAVKETITRELQDQKKIEILKERTKGVFAAVSKLKKKEDLEKYLKDKGLTLSSNKISHGDQFLSYAKHPGFDDLMFSPNTLLDTFLEPLKMDKDFVILKIKSREIIGQEEFKQQKVEFYQKKIAELKNEYFSAIIFQKQSDSKIVFNKKLYDEIVDYQLARFN